jgi:hypothetical protein
VEENLKKDVTNQKEKKEPAQVVSFFKSLSLF